MSITALVFAAALGVQQPDVSLDTGLGLKRACEDESSQLLCLGYIKGVVDALDIYGAALRQEPLYCLPNTITMGDIRDVVVADLEVRRDLWAGLSLAGMITILRTSFPCPTSAASPSEPDQ